MIFSKAKFIFIYITITFLPFTYSMEQSVNTNIDSLPWELKSLIAQFLVSENLGKSIKNLINFSQINKQTYQELASTLVVQEFVKAYSNRYGYKQLIDAFYDGCSYNKTAIMDFIIKSDINLEDFDTIKDEEGLAILGYAIGNDKFEIVKALIEKNPMLINVTQTSNNYSPLTCAALQKNFKIVEFLISKGAQINKKEEFNDVGSNVLIAAVFRDNTDLVKYLLNEGADPNLLDNYEFSPLFYAMANKCDIYIAKLLLDHGANIHTQNNEMVEAASEGYLEAITLFLNKGLNPDSEDSNGDTILTKAAWEGNIDILKYAMQAGANINHEGVGQNTALVLATLNKQCNMVKFLLEAGADMHHRSPNEDYDGNRVLTFACLFGWLDIIKLLIDKGIDVNSRFVLGSTPLLITAARADLNCLELLVEAGADVNHSDDNQNTALTYATQNRDLLILEYLLSLGLDINHQNINGDTPLICAAKLGNNKAVLYLLKKGADSTIKNNNNLTALDIANQSGHTTTVLILSSYIFGFKPIKEFFKNLGL